MSGERPRISVIIPLYNGGKFIRTALDSVFAQTMPPDEVIVVDDGSTDDGAAVVEEVAKTHPLILIRKQNGGQSSARNLGAANSSGQLLAFLDQDDIWYPNHLEILVKPFLKKRIVPLGWVYGNLDEIDEQGRMVTRSVLRLGMSNHPKRDIFSCLRTDMFILPSASLVCRDAFHAVQGFDESLSGYEDDDLFLRLFRAGYDNVYVDEAITQWRIFSSSASFSARMARSRMIYFRKLIAEFPDDWRRNIYYTRDAVAPRFFPFLVNEYTMALRARNRAAQAAALADLRIVARYHKARVRVMVPLFVPLAAMARGAPGLFTTLLLVRPIVRRLLR
jgi:glycosyltransferase involved in cell wall biosynthesis